MNRHKHVNLPKSLVYISALLTFLFFLPLVTHAATIGVPSNYLSLNSGLVGWWTMDGKDTAWTSATAATTLDKSGSGNTGTLTNMNRSTATVPGKVGQGLKFDGVDDYVNMGTDSSLKPSLPVSVAFWVYSNNTSDTGSIFRSDYRDNLYTGFWVNTTSSGTSIGVSYGSNGIPGSSTRRSKTTSGVLTLRTWNHVTAIIRGATDMSIYVNGVDVGGTYSGTGGTMVYTTGPGVIGKNDSSNSLPEDYFNGSIDDVRIYNRALSASEVLQLYNATGGAARVNASQVGPGNLNSGLVGWWTMDGADTTWTSATAATTLDKSGSGNTGTLTNMNRSTATVPGKIGQGLKFDGVDDYVSLGVRNDNVGTLSLWFKPNVDSGVVFSSSDIGTDTRYINFLYSSGKLQIAQRSGDAADFNQSDGTITVGAWNHAVYISNGSSYEMYINGVAQSITTTSGLNNGDWFADTSARDNMLIGARIRATISAYDTSIIDDVRIYNNRVLSASEVRQLYNATGGAARVNDSQVGPGNLNSGLVGWWTMDGADTTWNTNTLVDKSGSGNTMQMFNLPTTTSPTPGKIGQGLVFNGTSSYANIGSRLASQPVTLTGWVKTDGTQAGTIVSEGRSNGTYYVTIGVGATGVPYAKIQYTGNVTITGSASVANRWAFIAGVFDNSTTNVRVTLYVDGVSQGSDTNFQTFSTTIDSTTIGRITNSTPSTYMKGTLDDIRVYNRALSASEIQQLYQIGR